MDLRWTGDAKGPAITLVGKGVTFDTGGLDIKPPSGMLIMKKDMGGAATALALATMIMDAGLGVRLRVLLPIVENAISSTSFRPGDIVRSRKGLTVEIGNTDAEGRLILADALAYADEEEVDLLLDFATLTGAARVALGPDLPAFFTTDDALAATLAQQGEASHDPVWRMPLWAPYAKMLDSRLADLNNVAAGPFAGSVVAALFLQRFVSPDGGVDRVSREHVGVVIVVDALVVLVRAGYVQELVTLLGRVEIGPREQEARALVDHLGAAFAQQREVAGDARVFTKRERDVAADVNLLVTKEGARRAAREDARDVELGAGVEAAFLAFPGVKRALVAVLARLVFRPGQPGNAVLE